MHLENSDAQKVVLNLVIYQEKISYHISAKLLLGGQDQLMQRIATLHFQLKLFCLALSFQHIPQK